MTFINASLLAGVIMAGLPILLHLMMRAKPKRIEFPALRLLQSRQTSNSRKMRVRHLLLLLLRAILIAVAVLALTRPSLPAARYGLRWYEWCLLAAVVALTYGVYRWKSAQAQREEPAEHLLRERRGRLRAISVLGGLLAALLCVGIPWGVRLKAEIMAPRSPLTPDIPVAAVFVFDDSLSMSYKQDGQTRLEQAQQMTLDRLTVLPNRSRVAITTTQPDSEAVFQADLAGVRSRVEDLKTHAVPRPLNAVVKDAIQAQSANREQVQQEVGGNDSFVREIYLLTDLSEAAWNEPDESGLKDLLVQYDWLQVYVIDVSVSKPNNVALSQLRLDRDTTVAEQPVNISVAISGTPAANPNVILELFTLDDSGEEVRGGGIIGSPQRSVQLEGSAPSVSFAVKGTPGADFTSGYIRLATPDPMTVDDVRYFTFGVTPVPKVLLVGDRDIDTWLLLNLLQPQIRGYESIQRFECKAVTPREFGRETLANYDVICVMNWARPPNSAWRNLQRFVDDGGGLLVTAGGEQQLATSEWTTPDSQALLPGVPVFLATFRGEPARLNLVAGDNPIVAAFEQKQDAQTELNRAIFDKCWTLEQDLESRVLMSFVHRNQQPALLERSVGSGRVLMFTSSMDNNGTHLWNEDFVVGENWSFVMLIDEIMKYLTGAASAQHNFTVATPVEVDVPASQRFSQYRVERPRFRLTKGMLPLDESSVLLTDIDEAGHYQLRAADEGNTFHSDFAANIRDQESNLDRISDDSLNQIFGADRYFRARDPKELDQAVNLGRLGVEVFPVLMGLLILLFCTEHLMANYFYDSEPVVEEIPA